MVTYHLDFSPFFSGKKFENYTISPFTASAWERVGIEKEFKYTYLQFTYTTAGDTNGNSNVSWVWYLGVLTCIVKRLFSL